MTWSVDRISLHETLDGLLEEMQDLTGEMLGVMIALGGLALLLHVTRIGVHALSDPGGGLRVDRLIKPMLLLLLVVFFRLLVLSPLTGILSGVSRMTSGLVEKHSQGIEDLLERRNGLEKERLLEDSETAFLVDDEAYDKQLEALGWSPSDLALMASMYMERSVYRMKMNLRQGFVEILELLFEGAACIVDVLRCFLLCVLSLLGPLSLALSIFPVFSGSFSSWLARYVQVFLYLPLTDIFSLILSRLESLMIEKDIEALEAGYEAVFSGTSTLYILYLIMGTIGYLTVPYVATYVVQSSGMQEMTRGLGTYALLMGGSILHHGRGGAPPEPSESAHSNKANQA